MLPLASALTSGWVGSSSERQKRLNCRGVTPEPAMHPSVPRMLSVAANTVFSAPVCAISQSEGDVVPAEGMLALLAAARDVVGIEGDEGVLFLLRVDPFHDPVPDEVGEPEAAHLELVDVFSREDDVAFLDDQQRPPDAALVAVEDHLAPVLAQADVAPGAEEPRPPPLADLADEELRVLVEADEVSVDVDPRELGLLPLQLLRPGVREKEFDFLLREAFGNVDHEGAILAEAAILPCGSLAGAEPAPLRP